MTYHSPDSAGNAEEAARRAGDRGRLPTDATVTPRQRRLLAVALVAVVGLVGWWLLVTGGDGTVIEPVTIRDAEAHPDGLDVAIDAGDCTFLPDRTRVTETSDTVTVHAYVESDASDMSGCGRETPDTWVHQVVPLDAPLGDRRVVDDACLQPAHAARCRYPPR